jgi:hypothetical protein
MQRCTCRRDVNGGRKCRSTKACSVHAAVQTCNLSLPISMRNTQAPTAHCRAQAPCHQLRKERDCLPRKQAPRQTIYMMTNMQTASCKTLDASYSFALAFVANRRVAKAVTRLALRYTFKPEKVSTLLCFTELGVNNGAQNSHILSAFPAQCHPWQHACSGRSRRSMAV